MPTRRQFIKQSAGMVTLGMVMPNIWLREARAQAFSASDPIFLVIQLEGGNDGLNTVIPYTDSRYYSFRPTLSFKDSELVTQGSSTIISNEFGLHPAMGALKGLYDQGKVAIVLGVGYPNPNLSHFSSMDIWHTADPVLTDGLQKEGWLGRYADLAYVGNSGITAASIGSSSPRTFLADKVVIPNITSFTAYTFQTDSKYAGDRRNQLNVFNQAYIRSIPDDAFFGEITRSGMDAVTGAAELQSAVATYASTVTYPAGNPLAAALKMAAQMIVTIPEVRILYVRMGGFDNHSQQIGNQASATDKLVGAHATLLKYVSEGVQAFHSDMTQHGLADRVLMMQWSEFGRRPNENASFGTDHGTASPMLIIGNRVRGGLYGQQPSLDATQLDRAGNMVFRIDFREVYGTILDGWLGADHRNILGAQFDNVGFL